VCAGTISLSWSTIDVTISRPRAALAAVISIGVATVVAACSSSSSTGPSVTVAQVAQHYDAIAGQLLLGSDPSDTGIAHAIELFNGAVAAGQMPTSATVNSFSPRGWLGNVINLVDSTQTDSVQIVSLWLTGNIKATIQSFYVNGQFSSATLIDSGNAVLQDTAAMMTASFTQNLPDTCAFTQITNTSSTFPTFDPQGSACTGESTNFSGKIEFTKADTAYLVLDLDSLNFESQHLNGVRLQFNSSAAFPSVVAHALGSTHFRIAR
jgi:hypothetical protein